VAVKGRQGSIGHHDAVSQDLVDQLAAARSSRDAHLLIDLGCALAEADQQSDAEWCFRRAVELGETWASYNLGIALSAQERWQEAIAAYEAALQVGETDAWLALGYALSQMGDLAGSMRALREGIDTGDSDAALELAFMLREQGERDQADVLARSAAEMGNQAAKGAIACWAWDRTLDPSLEQDLREGADHYPSARADLADLLTTTGRAEEARSVLEQGTKLGEVVCWLPLGNLCWDEFNDEVAAEFAFREGIAAGDAYGHLNLGRLLASHGDVEGAEEQYRLGAAAGDSLAADALRDLHEE
jgi:tetratricopeptide (TPR) repeat protein